jgi:uncharacterized membrane protein
MRIASVGHLVLAVTLIGLGIFGLIKGSFAPIWPPVPRWVPARELLAYLCGLVSLGCGTGLISRRAAATAARVLLAYLLLWTVLFKGRYVVLQPLVEGTYQSLGENAVLIAGAWVLYAWFAAEWDRRHVGFATGNNGVHIARVIYALAMIAFGLSHFFYLNLTTPLVPGWLPWHLGWAYFTGGAYLAAGLAMLAGICARLAAVLSTLQMGGFTFLVWAPLALAGTLSDSQWVEFGLSWALTAAGWVVADSYRGAPWLAMGRRSRQWPS